MPNIICFLKRTLTKAVCFITLRKIYTISLSFLAANLDIPYETDDTKYAWYVLYSNQYRSYCPMASFLLTWINFNPR